MADAPLPESLGLTLAHCGKPMRLHHGHPTGWEGDYEVTGAVYNCRVCPSSAVVRFVEWRGPSEASEHDPL